MKTLLRNVRSVFIIFALVLTVCYSQSRYVYAAMSPLDTSGQWVSNEDEGFINNAENEPNSEYAQANLLQKMNPIQSMPKPIYSLSIRNIQGH